MRLRHAALLASLAAALPAAAQSLTILEPLPGWNFTNTRGLSADGQSVIGDLYDGNSQRAFLWSPSTGYTILGTGLGRAAAISADASTVYANSTGLTTPYRWNNGSSQNLGVMAGFQRSTAAATDGTGAVAVGTAASGTGTSTTQAPFRWTPSGGYTQLPYLNPLWTWGEATGVSRDGNVVVGTNATSVFGPFRAYRWTAEQGTVPLMTSGMGFTESHAAGISGDGTTVFGSGTFVSEFVAWRWTPATGMVSLGMPDGARVAAAVVSNYDGSTIACWISFTDGPQSVPYLWTNTGGLIPFADFIGSHGLTLPTGYDRISITGISDDGLTYSGILANQFQGGNPPRGFVVTVPSPSCGAIFISGMLLCVRRRRRYGVWWTNKELDHAGG